MTVKLDEFRHREGRDPSPKERAALEREASADTRGRKSGLGVADLATRWRARRLRSAGPSNGSSSTSNGLPPTVPRRTR